MVVLMVFTIGVQIFYDKTFAPVINHLPMSLATHKLARRFGTHDAEEKGGFDLFSRESKL